MLEELVSSQQTLTNTVNERIATQINVNPQDMTGLNDCVNHIREISENFDRKIKELSDKLEDKLSNADKNNGDQQNRNERIWSREQEFRERNSYPRNFIRSLVRS